jgi:hypothetical protein
MRSCGRRAALPWKASAVFIREDGFVCSTDRRFVSSGNVYSARARVTREQSSRVSRDARSRARSCLDSTIERTWFPISASCRVRTAAVLVLSSRRTLGTSRNIAFRPLWNPKPSRWRGKLASDLWLSRRRMHARDDSINGQIIRISDLLAIRILYVTPMNLVGWKLNNLTLYFFLSTVL